MNPVERPNKRADALMNRTRLLEVALAVFAQNGLDLEMADITSRAQVGMGTLYRHFGNREDLLRAIVTEVVEHAATQIRLAINPYTNDPLAALHALISTGLEIQQQYGSLFRVIRDPRMRKLFDSTQRATMRAQFHDQAREIVEQGIKEHIFRDDIDPRLIAATIFGSFTNVFESLGTLLSPAELERQLTLLVQAMLIREQSIALFSHNSANTSE